MNEQKKYGFRVEIESSRPFKDPKIAQKLRDLTEEMGRRAEREPTLAQYVHDRLVEGGKAPEVWADGDGWSVRAEDAVMLQAKRFKGGKEEAQKVLDGLVKATEQKLSELGWEGMVKVKGHLTEE